MRWEQEAYQLKTIRIELIWLVTDTVFVFWPPDRAAAAEADSGERFERAAGSWESVNGKTGNLCGLISSLFMHVISVWALNSEANIILYAFQ